MATINVEIYFNLTHRDKYLLFILHHIKSPYFDEKIQLPHIYLSFLDLSTT